MEAAVPVPASPVRAGGPGHGHAGAVSGTESASGGAGRALRGHRVCDRRRAGVSGRTARLCPVPAGTPLARGDGRARTAGGGPLPAGLAR